jgi:hypothetical protein
MRLKRLKIKEKFKYKSTINWTFLLRKILGYDAVYDEGYGIIHQHEPNQILILNPKIISNIETLNNSNNPFLNAYNYSNQNKITYELLNKKQYKEIIKIFKTQSKAEENNKNILLGYFNRNTEEFHLWLNDLKETKYRSDLKHYYLNMFFNELFETKKEIAFVSDITSIIRDYILSVSPNKNNNFEKFLDLLKTRISEKQKNDFIFFSNKTNNYEFKLPKKTKTISTQKPFTKIIYAIVHLLDFQLKKSLKQSENVIKHSKYLLSNFITNSKNKAILKKNIDDFISEMKNVDSLYSVYSIDKIKNNLKIIYDIHDI